MSRPNSLILAFAVSLVGFAPHADGQTIGNGGGGNERFFARIFKDITLSQSQLAQRDSVMEAMRARQPVITPGMGPLTQVTRDSIRLAMTAFGTQRNAALRTILTAEQQKVFDANVQAMEAPSRPPKEAVARAFDPPW